MAARTARRPPEPPEDPYAAARDICYRLLGIRARSQHELRVALLDKGIDEKTADDVLGKFDRAGLINDETFAEGWARSRHQFSGLSRRAVVDELRRKGVDEGLAKEVAAEQIDSDSEEQRARELARKKLRSLRGLDQQVALRRLVAALGRKGYAAGLCYRIAKEELGAQEHVDALDHVHTVED